MPYADPLLNRQDSVLVIIDAQGKLMRVMSDKEPCTDNLIRLAAFSRVIDLPVVLTEQQKLGPTIPEIMEPLEGSPVVSKITFDCFACSDFSRAIADLDKATLILCGIESHICVLQTALVALKTHRVQVITDAVSSRSKHNWEIAIRRMEKAGCELTTTEMVIYELLRKAGTDEFREVLPLVK